MKARNRASLARRSLCARVRSWTSAASMSAVTPTTLMNPATSTASSCVSACANGPKSRPLPTSASVAMMAVTAVTPGWPKRNALQTISGKLV